MTSTRFDRGHDSRPRIEVTVYDKRSLQILMRNRGYSVRTLADAVEMKLKRDKRAERKTCSAATIGHLTNPADVTRWSVNIDIANKVAEVLNFPVESLFGVTVSNVPSHSARKAA